MLTEPKITPGSFKSFHHKYAYERVVALRDLGEYMTDWEMDWILGVLENGRLSDETYKLSQKEFQVLQRIVVNVGRRIARKTKPKSHEEPQTRPTQ